MSENIQKRNNKKIIFFSPLRLFNRGGFTLIELLVVIAMISLLVAFFLVGLQHYRNNARDAGIKILLLEIRNVAELYHDDNHTFIGVCDQSIPPDGTLSNNGGLGLIETSINNNGSVAICKDSSSAFAVISPLKNGNCWCVDSTSSSEEIGLSPGETCVIKLGNNTNCP